MPTNKHPPSGGRSHRSVLPYFTPAFQATHACFLATLSPPADEALGFMDASGTPFFNAAHDPPLPPPPTEPGTSSQHARGHDSSTTSTASCEHEPGSWLPATWWLTPWREAPTAASLLKRLPRQCCTSSGSSTMSSSGGARDPTGLARVNAMTANLKLTDDQES